MRHKAQLLLLQGTKLEALFPNLELASVQTLKYAVGVGEEWSIMILSLYREKNIKFRTSKEEALHASCSTYGNQE